MIVLEAITQWRMVVGVMVYWHVGLNNCVMKKRGVVMIDRKNYSDDLIQVRFSIGGVEHKDIQEQVIQVITDFDKTLGYEFRNEDDQIVMVVHTPIQVIPEIVSLLGKKDIAIYEVSKLGE